MISAKQVIETGPGEVLTAAGLFRRLDPLAIIELTCVEIGPHASGPRATFAVSYEGIALGEWIADVFGEEVKWTF